MTDPAAGKALREALPKAAGPVKVGIVNSLGMRGCRLLRRPGGPAEGPRRGGGHGGRRGAGRIGARVRRPAGGVPGLVPKEARPAAIDASLDLAQRLAKKGDKDEAAKTTRSSTPPRPSAGVRRAALQGLAMVKLAETTSEILKALSSEDATFRGLAVSMN